MGTHSQPDAMERNLGGRPWASYPRVCTSCRCSLSKDGFANSGKGRKKSICVKCNRNKMRVRYHCLADADLFISRKSTRRKDGNKGRTCACGCGNFTRNGWLYTKGHTEEEKWLRKAKRKLVEVQEYLREEKRHLWQSPRRASSLGKTSQTA